MKTYEKIVTSPRLVISQDEYAESPRECEYTSKLVIQTHRQYSFPNELDFDFNNNSKEEFNEFIQSQEKEYFIFSLDCYIHSGVSFSLSWEGIQCAFDTSNNCGYILIKKEENLTIEDARKDAEVQIEEYNAYLNGDIYSFILYDKDGKIEDSCWGFYNIGDIRGYLPKEFDGECLHEYLK